MQPSITPGAVYWIKTPTNRFRARVIDRAYSVAGWWVCELIDGKGGRILPGDWFLDRVHSADVAHEGASVN
jgi:hypothetical protein